MKKKLNIRNLRCWIPTTIKKIFSISKYCELKDCNFLVYNITNYPEKLTFKWYQTNKKYLIMLKEEKWMTLDNLTKIWNDIKKTDEKKYHLSQKGFYKSESKEDTWIEWKNFKIDSLSYDLKIKDLKEKIQKYISNKNIDGAQAILGGSRKILDAHIKTAEQYFNKNYLSKIKRIFNNCNFAHDNRNGEEKCCDDNGKIIKKGINQKLKNFTNNELFKLCDYLVSFLDIFLAMLELNDYGKKDFLSYFE